MTFENCQSFSIHSAVTHLRWCNFAIGPRFYGSHCISRG